MRTAPALLLLLVVGALSAGCGSQADQTTSTGAAGSAASTQTASPTTTTQAARPAPSGGGVRAVQECSLAVTVDVRLTAARKQQLLGVCEEAASGEPADIVSANRKRCRLAAEAANPAGSAARRFDLKSCASFIKKLAAGLGVKASS